MFQVSILLLPPKEKCILKLTKEVFVNYEDEFLSKPIYLTVLIQLDVENFECAMSDL